MQFLMNRNGTVITLLAAGYLLGSRTVYESGNNSYTPPAGCRLLFVELIGGGARPLVTAASGAGAIALAGGGSAGTYASGIVLASVSITAGSTPFQASVGIGGASSGASGAASTFSSNAGAAVNPTGAGILFISTNASPTGTALASGSAEAFVLGGTPTATVSQGDFSLPAGQAGGLGHRVSGTVALSGHGGKGTFGGRPGGRVTQGTGAAGGKYGGGGSGGLSVNAGGAASGGNGGAGLIVIWEFF